MKDATTIIKINNAVPRIEHLQFKNPINWRIKDGEHWAVIGPNGSGKTVLMDILLGKYALKEGEIISVNDKNKNQRISSIVKSVAFRDIYGIIDTQNSYYQQRWNKGDDQKVPIACNLVSGTDSDWLRTLLDWFCISNLMDKEVDTLSSGELRKFLIVRSLLSKPRILILDNPFIGLDAASRITLDNLLVQLSGIDNLQVVLVLSNPADIPEWISHVLPVYDKELLPVSSYHDFISNNSILNKLFKEYKDADLDIIRNDYKDRDIPYAHAAILNHIHIKYGNRTILENLDWKVKRGEKWALLGANGSGKSTLLSLICGDNPQAYANDIILFDKKRGTGESIWDIKKRIGYISPEMHLYYLKNVRCLDVVGSGFFDTIGLYRKCNRIQEGLALWWMELFHIEHLKDISFLSISSGEQRLVLLARVFVKNPDLLILDEPLHGLDVSNKKYVKKLIENFCGKDKSLIYVTHYESEIPDIVNLRLVLTRNE